MGSGTGPAYNSYSNGNQPQKSKGGAILWFTVQCNSIKDITTIPEILSAATINRWQRREPMASPMTEKNDIL